MGVFAADMAAMKSKGFMVIGKGHGYVLLCQGKHFHFRKTNYYYKE
jgi:hypothetical protein